MGSLILAALLGWTLPGVSLDVLKPSKGQEAQEITTIASKDLPICDDCEQVGCDRVVGRKGTLCLDSKGNPVPFNAWKKAKDAAKQAKALRQYQLESRLRASCFGGSCR